MMLFDALCRYFENRLDTAWSSRTVARLSVSSVPPPCFPRPDVNDRPDAPETIERR